MNIALCSILVLWATFDLSRAAASETRRYDLESLLGAIAGSVVEPNPTVIYKKLGDVEGTLASAYISVGTNYAAEKYQLPTYSVYIPKASYRLHADYSDYIQNEACLETRLIDFKDLVPTMDNVPDGSLIIFREKIDIEKLANVIKTSIKSPKRVKFGFLKVHPLNTLARRALIPLGAPFFENLELPSELLASRSNSLFAFKFIFSPFRNATSNLKTTVSEAHVGFVNLAELTLFDADTKFDSYCRRRRNYTSVLSHRLSAIDSYPLPNDVEDSRFVLRQQDGNRELWLRFSNQIGTHLVAPFRFDQTKMSISQLPKTSFFTSLVRIPVNPFKTANKITAKYIREFEASNDSQIPSGAFVILDTSFGAKLWSDPAKYVANYPTLELDAAKFLVETRKVSVIAIDTISLDDASKTGSYPIHSYLADKNIPVVLNLKIDDSVFPWKSSIGSRAVITLLRTNDETAAPAAIFALPSFEQPTPPESGRWQLGLIIRSDDATNITPVSSQRLNQKEKTAVKERLLANEITLTVDPKLSKVTTYTAPWQEMVLADSMQGCLRTFFVKTLSEARAIKLRILKAEPSDLFLFWGKDLNSLDSEVVKALAERKAQAGFFYDSKLPPNFADELVKAGVSFYENLDRPAEMTDERIIEKDEQPYFAFKFVFAAVDNETSLRKSKEMNPPRKINLADLVVFERLPTSEDLYRRCGKPGARDEVRRLSQPIGPASYVPRFEGVVVPQFVNNSDQIKFSDHYATHFDPPFHFEANSFDSTNLPFWFDNPIYVKMKVPQASSRPNYSITKEDVQRFETETKQAIPDYAIILIDTDFGSRWQLPSVYQTNFPGLSLEAAKWLVEERRAIAIAIDSMALDDFSLASQGQFPTHRYLAQNNIIAIVNVGRDLDYAPGFGGRAVLAYLRYDRGTGAPLALFGLPDVPTSRVLNIDSTATLSTRQSSPGTLANPLLLITMLMIFSFF